MERLKRVIRQALSEKAHRIKLQVGTEFEILAQQGIRMMPDGPLVDEPYLNLLYSSLFPKEQQDAIARKIVTKGAVNISNVGTVLLIASPLHPISLRLYLPPRGQEMFNADWERLLIRQPQPSEPKVPLDRSFAPDSMFSPPPQANQPVELDSRQKPQTLPPRPLTVPGKPAVKSDGHSQLDIDFGSQPIGSPLMSYQAESPTSTDLDSINQDNGLNELPLQKELKGGIDMFSPQILQTEKTRNLPKIPIPETTPSDKTKNFMGNFGAELLQQNTPSPDESALNPEFVRTHQSFQANNPTFGSPESAAHSPMAAVNSDFRLSRSDEGEPSHNARFDPHIPEQGRSKIDDHSQHETAQHWNNGHPSEELYHEPPAPEIIQFGPDDDGAGSDLREEKPIDQILRNMIEKRASDLHLTCNQPVCFRIDGDIQRIDQNPVDPLTMEQLLNPILPNKNLKEFLKINDTDFAYELPGVGRFRVNIFRDKNGVGTVIRHIPSKILTAEQLQLPAVINKFCQLTKGLVVVTGPTGSGKSTTLAAMIDWINKNRAEHILTIEDPVEFVHPQQKCLVNQREVHRHTSSFARALKAALREDPDIILIGEMRDLETIAIAIETAETGHLVFGTLHTTTAVSTVDRIIDQFPADRQAQIRTMLASSLKGVVAQTLLKKRGGGRVAAHEILVLNDAVSAMIREGKIHMVANHMQTQKSDGNVLLNESLFRLIKENLVDPEEAVRKSVDKASLLELLRRNNLFSQTSSPQSPAGPARPGSSGQKTA